MALASLAEGYGVKEITPAQIRIYERALKAIPPALLAPMVDRCLATRKGYGKLPEIVDLKADAEWARQDVLRKNPWSPCAICELTPGWAELTIDGVKRVTKCQCKRAYLEKLEALGAGQTVIEAPAVSDMKLLVAGGME